MNVPKINNSNGSQTALQLPLLVRVWSRDVDEEVDVDVAVDMDIDMDWVSH